MINLIMFRVFVFCLFFLPSVVVLSASREVLVSHSAWQESFNFDETGKIIRENGDVGWADFSLDGIRLDIKWEKYKSETFERTNSNTYILSSFPNNNHYEEEIDQAYQQLEYTFSQPFIKLNPYKLNHLSVLLKFPTSKPSKIKIVLKGKNGEEDLVFTDETFKTQHTLTVLGLYCGHMNQLELTAHDSGGNIQTTQINVQTQVCPNDSFFVPFLSRKITETRYFFFSNGTVYDTSGHLRYSFNTHFQSYFFPNEIILESRLNGLARYTHAGKLIQLYPYPNGFSSFTHGISRMSNGNFLVIGTFEGKQANINGEMHKTNNDHLIEIDYKTGRVVKIWDIGEILNPARSTIIKFVSENENIVDFAHLNSVKYDDHDSSLLLSGRHVGLFKIDYETGKLLWLFGPDMGYDASGRDGQKGALSEKILKAVDSKNKFYESNVQKKGSRNFPWPIFVHDGRIVSKGIFSLFDNGISAFDKSIYTSNKTGARIYEIDEQNKKIKLLWRADFPFVSRVGSNTIYDPIKQEVLIYYVLGRFLILDYNTHEILFEAIMKQPSVWVYQVTPMRFLKEINKI